MALITVSGEPGCRHEEVARLTANRLSYRLITAAEIRGMIAEEFGAETALPDKAYVPVVTSILARLATQHHVAVCAPGMEFLFKNYPGILRVHVVAPESRRLGTLMLDHRMERAAAKQLLRQLELEERKDRTRKFRRARAPLEAFDVVLNEAAVDSEPMSRIVEAAATAKGIHEQGVLSATAEAQIQFQVRLQLSKYGIAPPGNVTLKQTVFANQSEEIFANLLDFYRIAWQYEPKSFPIQWDKDGKVLEAFTPDFFLPEFDMFVELTTMKQSLVTKKNRKVKLLKSVYPHVNIQVFYQKDFQNLIFKHGLAGAATR
jgi:cytidylate kinase